jgi:site-specific recombinase XerD
MEPKPCLEGAQINGAVHHTTRHTFCSWLALKGASAHEIMAAAGHKTLSISARYTHLNPNIPSQWSNASRLLNL